MNYILQVNAFQECILEYELGAREIALWYALMGICNRTGWKEEVHIPLNRLVLMSGMSEASVKRARKRLEELGLIMVSARSGRQSATYRLVDLSGRGRSASAVPDGGSERNVPEAQARGMGAGACEEVGPEEGREWIPELEREALEAEHKFYDDGVKDDFAHFAGHNEPQSEPQTEPQSERIYKTKTYFSLSPHAESEHGFEQFWEAYPSGASERNAREAYAFFVTEKGVPEEDLLGAARNYARHCRLGAVPDKYVKHAANWLRELVYMDYLPGNWKENIVEYKKHAPSGKISSGGQFSCSRREYDYEELERQILAGGLGAQAQPLENPEQLPGRLVGGA